MREAERESEILVLCPFASASGSSSSNKTLGLISAIIQAGEQDGSDEEGKVQPSFTSPDHIPWHISNRYYEADVHFKLSSATFSALALRKATDRVKRGAKVKVDSNSEAQVDDEELTRRVRDVFDVLERPDKGAPVGKKTDSAEKERSKELERDAEGVDAVMIVVDRAQPLKEHQRLLSLLSSGKDGTPVVSGFDLAISLVVALPLPLDEASMTTSEVVASSEDLQALYTREGWEFVDLDENQDADSWSEDEEDQSAEEEDGLQGIARIREALETHTWPGLKRKNDRRLASRGGDPKGASPFALGQGDAYDEAAERALASLQMDLGSLYAEGTAEPTKQDEELAAAFLNTILASPSDSLPESSARGARSMQSMHSELERFLASEDSKWPVGEGAPMPIATTEDDEEAWQTNSEPGERNSTRPTAFEDDFSDFVGGQEREEGAGHHADQMESHDSAFEAQLDFDDVAMLQAMERDHEGKDEAEIDFESTLSVVMAQTERVRSIADPDRRREEAARIALAVVGQQH